MFAASAVAVVFTANADEDGKTLGEGGDLLNKINFGGNGYDIFNDIIKVPGGFVAVGYSNGSSFKTGDWAAAGNLEEVEGYGSNDAIMVKFTDNWSIAWRVNFGGAADDAFNAVTMVENAPVAGTNAVNDGYLLVAVGHSDFYSFGNGSWDFPDRDVAGYGGRDAIIVAYDENGTLVNALNFGGAGDDAFLGVTASKEGNICAVGYSSEGSFGTGIWQLHQINNGYGGKDAIMAVYTDGALAYARHFGGAEDDEFNDVAAFVDDDGKEFFFAVGYSSAGSFGSGSWKTAVGYGNTDAIIVGYHDNGSVYAALNFGGSGNDKFYGVGVGADGDVFAVGYSDSLSFGNGSWTNEDWGVEQGYGSTDAIIVGFRGKPDGGAEVIGAMNFGGAGGDFFNGVAVSPEGSIVAVGHSSAGSFGNGDWADVETGNGGAEGIAVGYSEGQFVGAMNFGGSGNDQFYGAALLPNGTVLVAGYSDGSSFGNGDWDGVTKKGDPDAIVVMFDTGMETSGTGGDGGNDGGNDFPVTYVAIAAVGIVALLGIAYVFVLKKP